MHYLSNTLPACCNTCDFPIVEKIPVLGKQHMTANLHSLLHLPEVVRHLGPLWAHSCFPYEDANGDLLTLFHGSHAVEKQVQLYMCHWIHSVHASLNLYIFNYCRRLSNTSTHCNSFPVWLSQLCYRTVVSKVFTTK